MLGIFNSYLPLNDSFNPINVNIPILPELQAPIVEPMWYLCESVMLRLRGELYAQVGSKTVLLVETVPQRTRPRNSANLKSPPPLREGPNNWGFCEQDLVIDAA